MTSFSSIGQLCCSLLSLSNLLAFLLFLIICFLAHFYQKQWTTYRNIPPGPKPWPLIGNLLIPLCFARKTPKRPDGSNTVIFDAITSQADIYGNIYSLFAGDQLVVVLNGFETIKDALLNHPEVFSDRPDLPLVNILTKRKGVIFAPYGPVWRKQRKFCHTSLRNFGLGKLSLEPVIQQGLTGVKAELLRLSEQCGRAGVDLNPLITNSVSNVICSLTIGQRFDHDDPEFSTMLRLIQRALSITGNSSAILINIFPLFYYLPFGVFKELRQVERDMAVFLKTIIAKHRETLDPKNPRDLTDMYLMEMLAQRAAGEEDSSFTEDYLFYIIGELFFAGTETTTNSALWFLLNMTIYPDIQEKVQAEIDAVVGKNRAPSMTDRGNLPFTEATIMEVERMHTVIPFAIPHMTSERTEFKGYTIPKGTVVLPSLWSVHRDPTVWDQPNTFNPARFLDADGELVRKEYFIPFGIGRRVCMGEQLGKMSLFLTVTSLMQAFKFRFSEEQSPPSLQGRFGLTLGPCSYKVCVTARDGSKESNSV